MKPTHIHQTHPEIVNRLKRAAGHLETILKMLETERSCLEVVQQLHAVESAIGNAKKALIHDHIDHCLEDSLGRMPVRSRKPLDEFKELTKYL